MTKPYIVGGIFGRGGSKGLPGKNIRLLAGKPLIAHAIEAAHNSQWIDRTIVSTDDSEIAEVARQYGAEVPFIRPAELAQDDSPEWFAWRHAVQKMEEMERQPIDRFVIIPPTSPLRTVADIDACIKLSLESDADFVITVRPSERNPYFNMVELSSSDDARLVIPPQGPIYLRQSAPVVYDITTVAYVTRPDFLCQANAIFEGKVKAVQIPTERALDIDTELDFLFAELLMNRMQQQGNGSC